MILFLLILVSYALAIDCGPCQTPLNDSCVKKSTGYYLNPINGIVLHCTPTIPEIVYCTTDNKCPVNLCNAGCVSYRNSMVCGNTQKSCAPLICNFNDGICRFCNNTKECYSIGDSVCKSGLCINRTLETATESVKANVEGNSSFTIASVSHEDDPEPTSNAWVGWVVVGIVALVIVCCLTLYGLYYKARYDMV